MFVVCSYRLVGEGNVVCSRECLVDERVAFVFYVYVLVVTV